MPYLSGKLICLEKSLDCISVVPCNRDRDIYEEKIKKAEEENNHFSLIATLEKNQSYHKAKFTHQCSIK